MSFFKTTSYFLLLSIVLFATPTFLAHGFSDIKIITEDYPPLNYLNEDNELHGPAVEIVRAIKNKIKVDQNIQVLPWKRGYIMALNEPNTLLFSMTRSEIRENSFRWIGPIAEKQIALYATKSFQNRIGSLSDTRNYTIGVQLGGLGEQILQSKGLKNFSSVSKAEQNLQMLLMGRIDLWLASNATVIGNCKKLNINPSEIQEVFIIDSSSMYLAFNKDTSDEMYNLWDKTYKEIYKQGMVRKIYEQFNLEFLYPSIIPN